jgi:monoamine oxidase
MNRPIRTRRGWTRRQFVVGAGAAGLLGSATLRAAERSEALVLGAGLAGLHSALLLEELGFRVTVLEADTQPGGRVRTRNIGGNLHELGASDVGVMYARVLDRINGLGLQAVPSSIRARPFSYHVGGRLMAEADWPSAPQNRTVGEERTIAPARLESHFIGLLNPLAELEDWLRPEHRALDVPIGEYLSGRGMSPAAIDLIGHTYNGNGVSRTSALAMFRDNARTRFGIRAFMARREAGDDIAALRQVAGGNQRLPEAMAAALENPVRYGQAAASVTQQAAGVTVTCLDGTRYQADFLVCALPLTALARLDFTPGLSAAKSRVAAQGEYYAATKFYLRPTAAFWDSDGYEPSMWTDGPLERVFALTDANDEVHTLLVWINGAGGRRIDQLEPDVARALVLDHITQLRPAAKGKLEVMDWHAWGRTPFIGGCGFSYAAGQVSQFAHELPRPEGRIHFAGEHTRRREFGMEAAMASAERVVTEIMEAAG